MKLYVDGFENTSAPNSGIIPYASSALQFSGYGDGTVGNCAGLNVPFHGITDEVRIYDHALNPAEIAQLAAERPETLLGPAES
jgi:hypothetical protein